MVYKASKVGSIYASGHVGIGCRRKLAFGSPVHATLITRLG